MRDHLVFTLYGPMQAWGTVAVGEVRPVAQRPTRSGLLGLLAAALGIRRGDSRLDDLNQAARVAVRQDSAGAPLTDYHTTQVPKENKKRVFRTRRQELGGLLDKDENLNTILSRREYLMNAAFTACVWLVEDFGVSIKDIEEALVRPRLNVYLGRKSCPPGLPFMPEVISADDELEALAMYSPPLGYLYSGKSAECPVWTEADHGDHTAFSVRDRVVDHGKRQFAMRREYYVPPSGPGDASGK